MIKELLDNRPDLRHYLFRRGFLITDKAQDISLYPFFGNWRQTALIGGYCAYVHQDQRITVRTEGEDCWFLIGHAYDPYAMQTDENVILSELAASNQPQNKIDALTGVFFLGHIANGRFDFLTDASSMQYACYGEIDGSLYITSHIRLVGDLLSLQMTDYAKRLVGYRWYHYMMGNYMPGDITCFAELTRVVPNTLVSYVSHHISVQRFYPAHDIEMCKNEDEYAAVIREAAQIMQNTMALIAQKWDRPAISLTGGIDSNTTFAAANGQYNRYRTFSYISMYRESVDAEQAKRISETFGVPWKRYDIPESNEQVPDFAELKCILEWNAGGIGSFSDSDIRKKIVLMREDVGDVEVKSWISETVRAYAYKYFGRTSFPKDLTARNYTSLYKIFLLNRRLACETDRYFESYWEHTQLKEHLFNYDESDFFVWEMMHGGKCGLDIGTMKTCFDITIPYNNRKLLDTLLRVPLEKRLSDELHLDMKKILNKELYDMNIRVVNLNETNARKKAINLYYIIHSHLPF